ncbi:hypothetical protein HYV88_04800 [Candidatus Woesearchaeota archaeon]|nr:hypothetical protein [Candidatus Woesearchaeota archaeon]
MLMKTGVPGLDKILKGGFRENASVLIKGAPGSGKTVLALNFIIDGAKNGEKGLFITTEDLDDVRAYAKTLGMNLEKYEKEKKVFLVSQTISLKKLVSIATPLDIIERNKIKRVAIDSLTIFKFSTWGNELNYRKEILDLINSMRKVLLVAISEEDFTSVDINGYQPEEYLFDGVIRLLKVRKNNRYERCIQVVKMRGQDHSIDIYPLIIKEGGMFVYPDEIPFVLLEKETDFGSKNGKRS